MSTWPLTRTPTAAPWRLNMCYLQVQPFLLPREGCLALQCQLGKQRFFKAGLFELELCSLYKVDAIYSSRKINSIGQKCTSVLTESISISLPLSAWQMCAYNETNELKTVLSFARWLVILQNSNSNSRATTTACTAAVCSVVVREESPCPRTTSPCPQKFSFRG